MYMYKLKAVEIQKNNGPLKQQLQMYMYMYMNNVAQFS